MKYFSLFIAIAAALTLSVNAMAEEEQSKTWSEAPNPLMTGFCKDGSCKCGSDFCPQGGHCVNKQCYCANPSPADGFSGSLRDEYLKVRGLGEFSCGYMINSGTAGGGQPTLYCARKNGCHTKDGVYFPHTSYYYSDFSGEHQYQLLNALAFDGDNIDQGYYIVGNPDALDMSLSEYGDCVFSAPPSKNIPKVKAKGQSCVGTGFYYDECEEGVKTVKVVDTKQCKGGHHYCHGLANNPVLKPENDGYACRNVGYKSLIKTWICTNDGGCVCGGKPCAAGKACVDNVCLDESMVKNDRKKITPRLSLLQSGADNELADLCGRESAEKLKNNLAEVIAVKKMSRKELPSECKNIDVEAYTIPECVTKRVEKPNRCQWRFACDTWNVPRANRDQYICEFVNGLYESRYHSDSYIYPKAVGLKCINDSGCVCKNGTIHKGEYCNVY